MLLNYETFFFFLFSSVALTSAIFVIYSTNAIYSVFFLILVFISMAGLLLTAGVDFLGIMLIIIYVGAITVLFLFIVMMLDIKIDDNNHTDSQEYLTVISTTFLFFFIEVFIIFNQSFSSYTFFIKKNLNLLTYNKLCLIWSRYPHALYRDSEYHYTKYINYIDDISNAGAIGQVLYTYYSLYVLIAGLILLIALIGSVMLLIGDKYKTNFLMQDTYKQVSRDSENAIYIVK